MVDVNYNVWIQKLSLPWLVISFQNLFSIENLEVKDIVIVSSKCKYVCIHKRPNAKVEDRSLWFTREFNGRRLRFLLYSTKYQKVLIKKKDIK